MQCMTLLALDPPPSGTWETIRVLIWIIGVGGVIIGVLVGLKRLRAPDEEKRRVLPSPLITKSADEFVSVRDFQAQVRRRDGDLSDMEKRLEKRIDEHEKLVRGRLHDISNAVHGVALEAKEGREVATEQFQKIEGRLGEMKSTTEHTNALAIRTDQRVAKMAEDLPEKIANAVARNGRHR